MSKSKTEEGQTALVPAGRASESKSGQDQKARPGAMAFYHPDGLIPAYRFAQSFAGEGGRIATLPDIMKARFYTVTGLFDHPEELNYIYSPPRRVPWECYFTTMSAEFYGLSAAGNHIIIVAHGVGPMRDLDHVVKAYRHQFRDKERKIRGGLIERDEFLRLESGHYGEVSVIDLKQYLARYEYPFLSGIDYRQAMTDPLLQARLGPDWSWAITNQYDLSRMWHEAHRAEDELQLLRRCVTNPRPPNIFQVSDNTNFSYSALKYNGQGYPWLDKYAMAHLLSIGRPTVINYSGSDADLPGVVTDISCHAWYDGTRLVGIRAGYECLDIHRGPSDLRRSIRRFWRELAQPPSQNDVQPRQRPFYRLSDDLEFSTYQQDGEKVMQSSEIEFKVEACTELGTAEFITPIEGYHGFFRYAPKDVRRLAPAEANAFVLGEPEIVWEDGNPERHRCSVTFYRSEVDTSRRIPTEAEVLRDFDLVMDLVLKDD